MNEVFIEYEAIENEFIDDGEFISDGEPAGKFSNRD